MKKIIVALVLALTAGLLAAAPASGQSARRTYTGTIQNADYRIEVPENWNGTLILFSHGYYPSEWPPEGVALATRPETEKWFLDHGYALAASNFQGNGTGWVYDTALRDQLNVLDRFTSLVGKPRRTLSNGMSMGGGFATLLGERYPDRFDGVLAQCADLDANGIFNTALDITFVVKTLLAPGADIDLVRPRDPEGSTKALVAAIEKAQQTKDGRARLALAGAVGNIPDWYEAHSAQPTELADRILAQSMWTNWAYAQGMGPVTRPSIESHVGGNPSWNAGVDYRRQLERSGQRDLAAQAYREAGLSLRSDLDRLARAPRIRPDARAVAFMYRYGVVSGRTPVPVVTLRSVGDGGSFTSQEQWYASQVRRFGNPAELRQTFVDRGGHCSFSAADEITALRALDRRVEDGRWPDTSPDAFNKGAESLGPEYAKVLDIGTGEEKPMPPAFASHTPTRFPRPSL